MTIKGLAKSAEDAAKMFATFSDEKPDLVPLGIDEVDDDIGGMFKGTLVVVAMDTGVGKSRFILGSALRFAERCEQPGKRAAIISMEDGEDVVGARLLAYASGIDSRKIRRKNLTEEEVQEVREGVEYLRKMDAAGNAPLFSYCVGHGLEAIKASVEELAEQGAAVIWLDYLQKVRGVSDDRRGEIGRVMSEYQRVCADNGVVAGLVSQFSRRTTGRPKLHHLKESGDIENEARLAILGYEAEMSSRDRQIVELYVAKSTFGSSKKPFYRATAESGMLEPFAVRNQIV